MINKYNLSCDNQVETVIVTSPIGDLSVGACPYGLHHVHSINTQFQFNGSVQTGIKQNQVIQFEPSKKAVSWLKTYFDDPTRCETLSGKDLCPHLTHSQFHQKVWQTLRENTVAGDKLSYGQLALMSGNVNASRAVGTAMKMNPYMLMIPCHRVVLANGSLGKYAGGQKNEYKQWLLEYEQQFKKKNTH